MELPAGEGNEEKGRKRLRSNQRLGFTAKRDVFGEIECVGPIDNLAVCIMGILGAKRRPSYQTLEHDSTDRPPIAAEGVALPDEYFRGDIIWRTHGRIGHDTTRLAPCVDLSTIAHRQVDLVQQHRGSVSRLTR